MNSVNSGDKVVTRCCPHVNGHVSYVSNDGISPPVLLVENLSGVNVVSLTNQIIRISCPACYTKLRHSMH